MEPPPNFTDLVPVSLYELNADYIETELPSSNEETEQLICNNYPVYNCPQLIELLHQKEIQLNEAIFNI